MALEDEPLFNAGRGAVYTSAGKQEMDAAIMDGRNREAGAVAGVCGPRNPILAARAVMEQSDHVFLIGASAEEFCRRNDLAFEETSYFYTDQRWNALQETLAMRRSGADDQDESRKHGTVGRRGARQEWSCGGRHIDRRHDRESSRSRRRQPGDRRGNLGR